MPDSTSCGLVLLAAGASRRMGRAKQLLPVNGKPLVRHVAEALLAAPVFPVIVVLGAESDKVAAALEGLPVTPVVNSHWTEGLGSSLRAGLGRALEGQPDLAAVIVALADLPNLSAAHLLALLDIHRRTGKSIVATECAGVLMPPVLFSAAHFPALLALRGDAGARSLIESAAEKPGTVKIDSMPDLDTPDDYSAFIRRSASERGPKRPADPSASR